MKRSSLNKADQTVWTFPVQYLKGVGEKIASLFAKNEIRTLWDLLLTLPKSYEDRRQLMNGTEIQKCVGTSQKAASQGVIESIGKRFGKNRFWTEATCRLDLPSDQHTRVTLVWFHDPRSLMIKRYPQGSMVLFRGRVQDYRGALQIAHPELSHLDRDLPPWEQRPIVPVYRELQTISTRYLRKVLFHALEREEARGIPETLPSDLVDRLNLPSLAESLRELHFPQKWTPPPTQMEPSGRYFTRVVFEELFMMALSLHLRRAELRTLVEAKKGEVPCLTRASEVLNEAQKTLPFHLTAGQLAVWNEIAQDLSHKNHSAPMSRLVQGDVGSGKTILAFLAAILAVKHGYQAALMAPTEILVDQHFQNLSRLFPDFASRSAVLKGSLTPKAKASLRKALKTGELRFVIGTQALLTQDTEFQRLGMVIIDEQHRFGVEQRLELRESESGVLPHLLVLTATPIPRSLALTLYGDLHLSALKEKPPGRIAIETHMVKERAREKLVERLKQFLDEGRQIYMVYPLVDENEDLDLRDVKSSWEDWSRAFPGVAIGLLHGKMKAKDKETVMADFKGGRTRILVSTTVIEVGVDVPNASVIVIEHAERFGLSQLHQLRGRVGRGLQKSFCILMVPDQMSESLYERMQVMVQSDDGFYIAEKDLDLRGPGEFLGRRQSGLPGFRVAHLLRDLHWMERARTEAERILALDPSLQMEQHLSLRAGLRHWWQGRLDLTRSG